MDWTLFALHHRSSDHSPICLKPTSSNWGPKPFKFYNVWLENDNLVLRLRHIWDSCRSPNIHAKFREIRNHTRQWCKTDFGSIDKRIREAEKEQSEKDQGDSLPSIPEPISTNTLDSLYAIKCSLLCQKSRLNWQLQGERNTRFFHRAIAKRRSANSIRRLSIGSSFTTSPSVIKGLLFSHFKAFLASNPHDKIFSLGCGFLPQINNRNRSACISDFTLSEIELALS